MKLIEIVETLVALLCFLGPFIALRKVLLSKGFSEIKGSYIAGGAAIIFGILLLAISTAIFATFGDSIMIADAFE